MRHFLLPLEAIARLAGSVVVRSAPGFLVLVAGFAHGKAARLLAARPAVLLAAPARRANRDIYTAKLAAEVVPGDPELQRHSHGKVRAGRLDKLPQSCGNPSWQTALRWLEQARGAMSPKLHAPGLLAPAPQRCCELLELQGNRSLPR